MSHRSNRESNLFCIPCKWVVGYSTIGIERKIAIDCGQGSECGHIEALAVTIARRSGSGT